MENLDKALAELAEKLGVGSESLMGWLSDGGLEAYARLQVTSYLADGLIWLVATLILVGVSVWLYKHNHAREDYYQEEFLDLFAIIGLVGAFITLFITLVAFENSYFWYANPDGMFVKMLLASIG